MWNRIIEGTSYSGTSSAQQTLDGGYIIADRTMLDRYTQLTPEQVKGEYLRTIPKLGI